MLTIIGFTIYLIAISIISGIVYLIFRALHRKKTGKIIIIVLYSLWILLILSLAFNDLFFTKKDARAFLKDEQVTLFDDFKILNSKSSYDRDCSQLFTLKISNNDTKRIVYLIRNSSNYKDSLEPENAITNEIDRNTYTKVYTNFRLEGFYYRQSYINDTSANERITTWFYLDTAKNELSYTKSY